MAVQAIGVAIFTSLHPNIAKRMNIPSLLISCVMLLIDILSFASTFELENKSSTVSMALIVSGTELSLLGIFRLFQKPKEVVYVPTGSIAKEYSIFFDLKHTGKLTDLINSDSFSVDSKIKNGASDNIHMDMILSIGSKFTVVQLFRPIPYIHQPATAVHHFTDDAAAAVAAFLTKS